MPSYRLTFQRGCMGRRGGCDSAQVEADDLGDLATFVHAVAARRMTGTVPDVVIDQQEDEGVATGRVYAGFDTVAQFTVEELVPAVPTHRGGPA
jgi:hypothetical protein